MKRSKNQAVYKFLPETWVSERNESNVAVTAKIIKWNYDKMQDIYDDFIENEIKRQIELFGKRGGDITSFDLRDDVHSFCIVEPKCLEGIPDIFGEMSPLVFYCSSCGHVIEKHYASDVDRYVWNCTNPDCKKRHSVKQLQMIYACECGFAQGVRIPFLKGHHDFKYHPNENQFKLFYKSGNSEKSIDIAMMCPTCNSRLLPDNANAGRNYKALETEGYVVKNDKNQYRIKKEITRDLAEHSWEQWLKVDSKVHYNDLMMNFFGETRTNLLPLLRGKLDPIDLFFPKGSFKVALAAYKDNIVSKCTNRVVVEDMLVLVKHFTKKYPQKQFRILEIGAGVGGVSIDLIEALKIYNVEYLFTDISRSFLNEAQERFKKYPWVKFGLYDINIDYWKQDIPTSYFDVILCNNVLHNANNEVKVLGQFKEIAAPNGNLIIIDATGNNYALMTSIEFLNGLNGVEDFRAENEQIFLQQDQWNKLFKKSDIELLAAFPEEDSTLKVIGQTVFVCKFNSKRRRIDPSEIKNYMANNLPEYMLPSHIEVLKEFPLTANGKIDRNILRNHLDGTLTQTTEQGEAPSTDLEKAIAQIWCDALKKEKIWKNENFYEIGGDSLLVAQVVAKMKEKIEEAKAWDWDKLMIALIESPTIEGISKKLMEGLPSEETKEKQESLIILKQGNNNKALVLIHDGTGTISPYNQVIPFLHSTEGSLLALQCNDMEEYLSVKPEKLIQFLGEKYAKILIDTEKEVYDLVGYCMGGLIALETAKILTEAGKTVHSLISVDTTPSRRMVNNELLMERAFGMIIGADTYKVGHTVEDELLKRAIKELGEKYGDNVSNEELVSLEGEFLPVSQCYGKLIKKTHAERLLELYNTLPATKGETSGYSKERLDTLYKVFCHSFSAVIMYDAGIYVGNALVLSCRNKNSSFLPVEPTDNERFWKEATVGNITSELIEGEHLTCMTGSYADKVAERILKEERL